LKRIIKKIKDTKWTGNILYSDFKKLNLVECPPQEAITENK